MSPVMRALPGLVLLATTTAPVVDAIAVLGRGEDTTSPRPLPTCYNPNGDRADGFYACSTTAHASWCCPVGHICSGSIHCVLVVEPSDSLTATVVQKAGSCTDPEWDGDNCGRGHMGEFHPPLCVVSLVCVCDLPGDRDAYATGLHALSGVGSVVDMNKNRRTR